MKINSNIEENATGETPQFIRQQLPSRDRKEPMRTVCVRELMGNVRTQKLNIDPHFFCLSY